MFENESVSDLNDAAVFNFQVAMEELNNRASSLKSWLSRDSK